MELSKKYKVFYISSFMDNNKEYGITEDGEFKSLDACILLSIIDHLFPSEEEA